MSAKKLTDKQIKNIISARIEGAKVKDLAKKYKVTENTIRKYCNSDKEFEEKCVLKKKENEESILEHMQKKSEIVCEILDKYLLALADPERLKECGTREIATALGIIIDKFTKGDANKGIGKIDEILGDIGNAAK